MKKFTLKNLTDKQTEELLKRPKMDFHSVFAQVQPILDDVGKNGDSAVRKYTQKFDGVDPNPISVDPGDLEAKLSKKVKNSIDRAMNNIFRFHREQMSVMLEVETQQGVICRRVARPIERVGLYVPGGTAPLPSTAMMLGIPALIAGCKTIVMATPPDHEGNLPDSIIYIAQKTGVKTILKAGGAQAIAAMAFGTQSVPKVDKIFGPGNQYVTAAKMLLQNSDAILAIDLPAGPSEVLVIADQYANPAFVASDLLSQAEHGSDSQAILVVTSGTDTDTITSELKHQLEKLPRKHFAAQALDKSYILVADDTCEAIGFSNRYAPEHLIINTKDADDLAEKVMNAGSVFIGQWTPESMGDYASGTNHTLPTYGYAKMYSGVNLHSFQKFITMQKISEQGLKNLGPAVETLAKLEGLDAHKNAVSLRLKKLGEKEKVKSEK
jgi:histidinol dehydrogenase